MINMNMRWKRFASSYSTWFIVREPKVGIDVVVIVLACLLLSSIIQGHHPEVALLSVHINQ